MSINLALPITFANHPTNTIDRLELVIYDTFPIENSETRNLLENEVPDANLVGIYPDTDTFSGSVTFADINYGSYYIFGPLTSISSTSFFQADLVLNPSSGNIITPLDGSFTFEDPGLYVAYLLPTPLSSITVTWTGTIPSNTIFVYNSYPKNVNTGLLTDTLPGTPSGDKFTYDINSYILNPINYIYGPINNTVANLNSLYGGDDITLIGTTMEAISGSYVLFNFLPVCFLKGTPVETDQGEVEIDKLVPGVNTINGKRIVKVVETYGSPTSLCLIKKDLIFPDVPNKDTVITKWHKVLFNGTLVKAKDLPGIHVCQYNGETLYNVLMDEHDIMKVNGMTVETLDPAHKINE